MRKRRLECPTPSKYSKNCIYFLVAENLGSEVSKFLSVGYSRRYITKTLSYPACEEGVSASQNSYSLSQVFLLIVEGYNQVFIHSTVNKITKVLFVLLF